MFSVSDLGSAYSDCLLFILPQPTNPGVFYFLDVWFYVNIIVIPCLLSEYACNPHYLFQFHPDWPVSPIRRHGHHQWAGHTEGHGRHPTVPGGLSSTQCAVWKVSPVRLIAKMRCFILWKESTLRACRVQHLDNLQGKCLSGSIIQIAKTVIYHYVKFNWKSHIFIKDKCQLGGKVHWMLKEPLKRCKVWGFLHDSDCLALSRPALCIVSCEVVEC